MNIAGGAGLIDVVDNGMRAHKAVKEFFPFGIEINVGRF